MHTIKLNVDDSIYDKLKGLLDILPKDKVEVIDETDYPAISLAEAKAKVEKAVNNIENNQAVSLDEAFERAIK